MYEIDDNAAATTKSFYRQLHFNKAIKIHAQRGASTSQQKTSQMAIKKGHTGICVHSVARNAALRGKRSHNNVQKCTNWKSVCCVVCDIQPLHLMPLIYTGFFVFEPLFTCFSGARMNMHSMTLKPQYINRTFSMPLNAHEYVCIVYWSPCIEKKTSWIGSGGKITSINLLWNQD